VQVNVTGGTATPGTDFTNGPYTVNFADGQTTATLNIPLATDTISPETENILLGLASPTNGSVLGALTTATLNITDVPPPPPPPPPATGGGAVGVGSQIIAGGKTITPFTGFLGEVRVAGGDVTGDGRAGIVTGAGPHVKAFSGLDGSLIRSFFAFDAGFGGGVYVAAGDVDNDGFDDILVGSGPGIRGHVKAFDGVTFAEIDSDLTDDTSLGGVYVS
jgi:hypothetical protein